MVAVQSLWMELHSLQLHLLGSKRTPSSFLALPQSSTHQPTLELVLSTLSGAAEAVTASPDDLFGLFDFVGIAGERATAAHAGSGSLFTLSGCRSPEQQSKKKKAISFYRYCTTRYIPNYNGSGRIASLNGAAESFTANPLERDFLYSISGIATFRSTVALSGFGTLLYLVQGTNSRLQSNHLELLRSLVRVPKGLYQTIVDLVESQHCLEQQNPSLRIHWRETCSSPSVVSLHRDLLQHLQSKEQRSKFRARFLHLYLHLQKKHLETSLSVVLQNTSTSMYTVDSVLYSLEDSLPSLSHSRFLQPEKQTFSSVERQSSVLHSIHQKRQHTLFLLRGRCSSSYILGATIRVIPVSGVAIEKNTELCRNWCYLLQWIHWRIVSRNYQSLRTPQLAGLATDVQHTERSSSVPSSSSEDLPQKFLRSLNS